MLLGLLVPSASVAEPLKLEVMTFNLRYASEIPPNTWTDRRPVVASVLGETTPDVFGTQEGVWRQIKNIAEDCPDYAWVGLGREGGSRGEFCAIFYRPEKYELIAFDHFWLSDTPDVIGSITWDHQHKRMATWGRFRERASNREFAVLNTHFDHRSELARANSAVLIRDRISQFPPELPLLVLGDFNCLAGDGEPYSTLTTGTGLIDTWTAAEEVNFETAPNTFHGYKSPDTQGRRIDWVLARNPSKVSRAQIVTTQIKGQFPSDHFPVTATVEFEE
ncbi:MAG: endonuclease/exonuclease/phosphatase family protein [Synoicihabitans sp.]